jgi:hypothetical protein
MTLPVSVVLFPGSMRPTDSVRVQVDATRKGRPVISNAALFTFAHEQSIRLDMVLYGQCLGNLDCSKTDMACYDDTKCHVVVPTSFDGEPDLGVQDLSIPDFGDVDLAPSQVDMTPDFAGVDLLGCVPQCSGKQCGSDNCGGSCGSCGNFEYCGADLCLACGGDGQFCCPSGQQCKFTLICNGGSGRCEQPMVGMEPPCGGYSQQCCPGQLCDGTSGLVCDGSNHCFPPPADMLSCAPQCGGKNCGPDSCGGVCGTCNMFYEYCDGTQNCASCGQFAGDRCCPTGPACSGAMYCDGKNTCQPIDMSPPCGMAGEMCCPNIPYCMGGLSCDGTNTCQPLMPTDGGLSLDLG